MKLKVRPKYHMTIDDHIELGQAIKDVRKAMFKVLDLVNRFDICTKKSKDKLFWNADRAYSELMSEAEDLMFHDYPFLDNRAIGVYYHDDQKTKKSDIL